MLPAKCKWLHFSRATLYTQTVNDNASYKRIPLIFSYYCCFMSGICLSVSRVTQKVVREFSFKKKI